MSLANVLPGGVEPINRTVRRDGSNIKQVKRDSKMNRREFGLAMGAALLTTTLPSWASQTLRMIVPFPAGGPSDTSGRRITNDLAAYLGGPVVVENIGGGSGSIGAQRMLRSRPDGWTMLYGSANETIQAPLLNQSVTYSADDFRMVALGGSTAFALAGRADLGVSTIDELIELGCSRPKAQPLTYGSVGIGSTQHLCCESLAAKTGMNMLHVPYPGAAPGLNDLMGGQIDLYPLTVTSAQQYFANGRLINFGVTSLERDALAPHLVSINEGQHLKDFSFRAWGAYFVSREVPREAQERLNAALNHVHQIPRIRELSETSGAQLPNPMTLEENARYYEEQVRLIQGIVRSLNLNI